MKVFISGGAKNGKSSLAQRLAREMALQDGEKPLYYIATMIPTDDEDRGRIARHVADREGMGFVTLEKPRDIAELLMPEGEGDPEGVFLLDSVTALLANVMFGDGEPDIKAGAKVKADLLEFCRRAEKAVFVSDYIYSEAKIFDRWTEAYREALAEVDKALAEVCHQVLEVSYGNIIKHKG